MSRHYIGPMRQKNWGRIVFISSESALQIPKEMIHYGMTKTAQLAVARGLAETTAGTGITVNTVLPGPTKSEGVLEFVGRSGRYRTRVFHQSASQFAATALCHHGGGCRRGGVRVQSAGIGDEWSSGAGGGRNLAVDCLGPGVTCVSRRPRSGRSCRRSAHCRWRRDNGLSR